MTAEGTIRDVPAIETARLTLRKLRLDDAEDMFAYASDPEVARHTTWEAHRSIEDSRAFLTHMVARYDGDDPFAWAIVHRAERTMIGTIGLGDWSPAHRRAELMYALGRRYPAQGVGEVRAPPRPPNPGGSYAGGVPIDVPLNPPGACPVATGRGRRCSPQDWGAGGAPRAGSVTLPTRCDPT